MSTTPIDYEALAKQNGAISYAPATKPIANGKMDYAALAKQHGAIASQPATPNPYQAAADRVPSSAGTSMSAGPPKPEADQPSFWHRFAAAVGLPTSQGETTTAVQNVLTPQPEAGATGLLKAEESLPVLGSDFRARAALARQGRPTAAIPLLGPAIANFVDSTVGDKPDTATALGAGVNVAGQALGLKGMMMPKAPMEGLSSVPTKSPAANILPKHVEALTGLIEDKGGTVDPHETATAALPHLRETAVRMKVDPSQLNGREAGQATLKVAEQAVHDTQDEFNTIKKPYENVLVDQKPIADAYRAAITPELLANEPKVATALEKQAKKFDQPAPLEQLNQFRTRMNNQLDAFEKRGQTAQIMSDIETKAMKAAANAARDVEYSTVGRLSGLDPEYVRALKQKEGSLIEAKSSLTKEYNRASGDQGEAASKGIREKVANTYPSPRGVKHAGIRELIGPKPIDVLNNRIQKMFSDMGTASSLPKYQQVMPPEAPQPQGGPSGPLPGGEDAIEEATRGGPGVQPPVAPDTSQTFVRPSRMGTQQGIADQVTAAKSGKGATADLSRVDQHKMAKEAMGQEVQQPVSPAYSYTPVDTSKPVSSRFYHGTKAELSSIGEADPEQYGQVGAKYGAGLYLTDNPEVAAGYAATKGKGAVGRIAPADLNNAKLINLDKPLPPNVQEVFDQVKVHYGDEVVPRTGATGKEVFAKLQEDMADGLLTEGDAQDIYADLAIKLKDKGYDGFLHKGGDFKGKQYGPHNVAIVFPTFDPANPISNVVKPPQDTGVFSQLKQPVAPSTVANGQITQAHVDAENAFYTQARAELGANAEPSAVLARAQALKVEHVAKGAPAPTTPVPPTLTQKMQAQLLPKLKRVEMPSGGPQSASGGSRQSQAALIMLQAKQGLISPSEADSRIQKLVGSQARRTVRMPVRPD